MIAVMLEAMVRVIHSVPRIERKTGAA